MAVYVLDGSALSIEVVDAATGRIRWRQPAATGLAAAGVEIDPAVVDGRVVYLRPVNGSMTSTTVVVADAVTGRDIAVSGTAYRVGSRPSACKKLVCFSAYSGSEEQALSMNPDTGRVTSAGAGTGGRTIGPEGLQSVQSQQEPEQLRRVVSGATTWKTPLATVFGAGYSTNGGWVFHSLPGQDLLIGAVGRFDPGNPVPTEIKLGTTLEMAGINLTDGTRRWLQTGGVEYQCLPQAAVIEGAGLVGVRCRWGAASIAVLVGDNFVLKAATLSVEGFDPATGATTWSVPLADPTGQTLSAAFGRIEVVGESTLLVPTPTGEELIDPSSGATRPAPTGTVAVCLSAIRTPLAGGERTISGRTSNSYVTGSEAVRCTGNGSTVTSDDPAWPSWVGPTVGNVHVVTTSAGLQAFHRSS